MPLYLGLTPPFPSPDVLDMVDVLVEGSEGLDEEVGFVLNEDMILLTFPFSALVPAALEARNKLLLRTESEAGTHARGQGLLSASGQLGLWRVGDGLPGALEIIAANPRQQGFRPTKVTAAQLVELSVQESGVWRLTRLSG